MVLLALSSQACRGAEPHVDGVIARVWKMNGEFWTKNETTIKNLVEKGKVIFDAFQADIDVDASSSDDDEELDLDEEE